MSDFAFVLEGTTNNFDTLVVRNSQRGPVLVDS
jgi:thioredoxin-like negative regulator of GroEL